MHDITTKTCRGCKAAKPLGEFYKHPQTRDGHGTQCKACDKARLKARNAKIRAQAKVIPASKTCPTCEETKPSASFGRDASRADGLSHSCKACKRVYDKAYFERNPEQREKHRLRSREFYADQDRYLDSLYRTKFGITWARYQEILEAQGGTCAICDKSPNKQRLSVDHDHGCCPDKSKSCGECVRGLLCSDCNFGLGLFKDRKDLLEKAVMYLG